MQSDEFVEQIEAVAAQFTDKGEAFEEIMKHVGVALGFHFVTGTGVMVVAGAAEGHSCMHYKDDSLMPMYAQVVEEMSNRHVYQLTETQPEEVKQETIH